MEQLETISDDSEFEFNSFNNETLEDSILYNLNDNLTDRTKANVISGDGFCKYFCGADCKYCKPISKFPPEKMAIEGLYSTWITPNILAMSRPSNEYIDKYDIIDQFKRYDINTVVNMQVSGEHGYCGFKLDPSGFSYDPNKFMENGIHHFNYPCDDYGAVPVAYLFDIMKTLQHRLTVGKIAVHCHAGHGRTGLVIACYLIFNNRMGGIRAINYVRKKRKGSIQNQLQVNTVLQFARCLESLRIVCWTRSGTLSKFSLQEAVMRQKKLVHGKETYVLHYVPKIIFLCLRKLSKIEQDAEEDSLFDLTDSRSSSDSWSVNPTPLDNVSQDNFVMRQHFLRWIKRIKTCFKKPFTKNHAKTILELLKVQYADEEKFDEIMESLNKNDETWGKVYAMKDIHLHCQLILRWFDDLKFPVLRTPDIEMMDVTENEDLNNMFLKLETSVGKTVALLLEFLDQFQILSEPDKWELYSIFFSRLTHKHVSFIGNVDTDTNVTPNKLKDYLVKIIQNVISIRMTQNK